MPAVRGDPGTTQFYLSLEDDLMRLFGGSRMDKIGAMMEKTNMPDDMPIQASMVSKAIESAQRQVESMHFAARKNVLEYDDVMNLQRKAIYEERNAILDGKDMEGRIPRSWPMPSRPWWRRTAPRSCRATTGIARRSICGRRL